MAIMFDDFYRDYFNDSFYCNDMYKYYNLEDRYYLIIDKCLKNGEFDRFRDCVIYQNCLRLVSSDKCSDKIISLLYKLENSCSFPFELEELLCMRKLYFQYLSKQSRLRSFVKYLVNKYTDLIFVTFTFTDEVLKNTTTFTRRKYVSRYLKSNCSEYVANVDFGKKYSREHYHGIATADLDLSNWNFGSINVKRITAKNINALAKYIDKLVSHALKSTTGLKTNIIYSRGRSISCVVDDSVDDIF